MWSGACKHLEDLKNGVDCCRSREASSDTATQILRGKSAELKGQSMLSFAIVMQQELRGILESRRIANLSGRKLQWPMMMIEAVVRSCPPLNILPWGLPIDMMRPDVNTGDLNTSEFAVSPVICRSMRLLSFVVEAKATKNLRFATHP